MSDDSDTGSGDVVSVDFAGPRLGIKPRTYRECKHPLIDVNECLWRIECRSCGEVLDAVHVLLEMAKLERSCAHWTNAEARAKESLALLKDEEKRIKARIRRAMRKETT